MLLRVATMMSSLWDQRALVSLLKRQLTEINFVILAILSSCKSVVQNRTRYEDVPPTGFGVGIFVLAAKLRLH